MKAELLAPFYTSPFKPASQVLQECKELISWNWLCIVEDARISVSADCVEQTVHLSGHLLVDLGPPGPRLEYLVAKM